MKPGIFILYLRTYPIDLYNVVSAQCTNGSHSDLQRSKFATLKRYCKYQHIFYNPIIMTAIAAMHIESVSYWSNHFS
jgi:hypothetical protein